MNLNINACLDVGAIYIYGPNIYMFIYIKTGLEAGR